MTADIEKEAQLPKEEGKKEDIFDLVGGDGWWQRWIFLVTLLCTIPSATHNLSMSFLAPNLDHWCARPEDSNWTVQEWKLYALPPDDKHCSRYKYINATFPIQDNVTITTSDETISCEAWEYDSSFYISTVLSEWDLVCDKEWLVSLSKSIYMAGTFTAGMLFGQLADTMGRRLTITVACCICVFSAVICAFSTSFTMFIVSRFFISLGISGVYNVTFVLLMELVGPQERSIYGVAMNFGWCIGFVSLPGIAYILKDWFWIQIVLTAPCLGLLAVWWLLPESPRWLMSKGRVEDAQKILTKAAKANGKKISDVDTRLKKLMAKATELHESGAHGGTYFDLLRTSGLWQMTLNIYLLWFVNSFVYYGLSYNTNEMAGNAFVNFAVCGAVEFPAYFLTILAIRSWGRKYPLAGAMIVGGIACLLIYPLPAEPVWLGITVSMIGKFCITCSFAIAFVFTAEIFPTVVRNIGLGSASVFARIGSILAPFVRELGNATHPVVPQIMFGVLAFVSGVLVFLLPETSNVSVPETIEEAAARNSSKKKSKNKNAVNGHVSVKLSKGSATDKDEIDDEGLTMVAPSPKLQSNGKKLDDVPEEDHAHHETVEAPEQQTETTPTEAENEKTASEAQAPTATIGEVSVQVEDSENKGKEAVEGDQKTNL